LFEESNQASEPTARKQPIKLPPRDHSLDPEPASPPAKQPAAAPAKLPPQAAVRRPETPPAAAQEEEEDVYDEGFSTAPALHKATEREEEEEPEDALYDDAAPASPVHHTQEPVVRNLLAQGLPKRQASDDEEEEAQDWDGMNGYTPLYCIVRDHFIG